MCVDGGSHKCCDVVMWCGYVGCVVVVLIASVQVVVMCNDVVL